MILSEQEKQKLGMLIEPIFVSVIFYRVVCNANGFKVN